MGTPLDKVLRMTLVYNKHLIVINVYMNFSKKSDLNIIAQPNFVKDITNNLLLYSHVGLCLISVNMTVQNINIGTYMKSGTKLSWTDCRYQIIFL